MSSHRDAGADFARCFAANPSPPPVTIVERNFWATRPQQVYERRLDDHGGHNEGNFDVSCERLSCGRVQPSSSPKREGEGCTLSRTRTKKRQQPLCAAISACERVPPYLLIYNYSVRVTRASRGGRPWVFWAAMQLTAVRHQCL